MPEIILFSQLPLGLCQGEDRRLAFCPPELIKAGHEHCCALIRHRLIEFEEGQGSCIDCEKRDEPWVRKDFLAASSRTLGDSWIICRPYFSYSKPLLIGLLPFDGHIIPLKEYYLRKEIALPPSIE